MTRAGSGQDLHYSPCSTRVIIPKAAGRVLAENGQWPNPCPAWPKMARAFWAALQRKVPGWPNGQKRAGFVHATGELTGSTGYSLLLIIVTLLIEKWPFGHKIEKVASLQRFLRGQIWPPWPKKWPPLGSGQKTRTQDGRKTAPGPRHRRPKAASLNRSFLFKALSTARSNPDSLVRVI